MPITALPASLREILDDLDSVPLGDLRFWHPDTAYLVTLILIGLALAMVLLRSARARRPARDLIALPAILNWVRRSPSSFVRHGALVLFIAGLPFFCLALADPFTSLTREEVTYPGRRIALMIDASSSMTAPFKARFLNTKDPTENAFATGIAAAEYFVRMRMAGKYRDLMAVIEFGDEAYVITPFTHDYDSILLSISLIGNPTEWWKFPNTGTVIAQAVDQGLGLFRAFDVLDSAGNAIVMITDGEDPGVVIDGKDPTHVLDRAIDARIPVYLIRVAARERVGVAATYDDMWKAWVQRTGGVFYAASDESVIRRAIADIDRNSVGKIAVSRYSTQRSRFLPFATIAAAFWALAALLKLTVPHLRTFP